VTTGASSTSPIIVIEPRRKFALRLDELWAYRELFFFLIWRDIKVRYKQTALGAAWALLQPLMLMVVFTLFLGQLAGVGPKGVPYPVFTLAALVPWTFFANALTGAANSVVGNSALVSKIYFPRILIPTAAAASYLIDLVISFVVLLVLMAAYNYTPSARIVLLPVFVAYVVVVAVGLGLLLSALNVRYRDVRYAVPFLIQFWLFASPVAYQYKVVGSQYRLIFALNPMVAGIEGFRSSVIGVGGVPASVFAISALSALAFVLAGFFYFRRVERGFADII
jgi:lipopolysaccharide transport system permease protein